MPLSLNTRRVGRVTVVRCSGRVVAGPEADSFREHLTRLLPGEKQVLLDLGEVTFMDSSGLGAMVRMVSSFRRVGGDIRLCQLPPEVATVLRITNLTQLFQIYEQEPEAIAAFYARPSGPEHASPMGIRLLCVDQSADVLAYVRELLGHAGYDIISSTSVPDALILLRAARPALLVLGPNLKAAAGTRQTFEQECCGIPMVELGEEFATVAAGEAGTSLLQRVQARLGAAAPGTGD